MDEVRDRAPPEMAQGTSRRVARVEEVHKEAPSYLAQETSQAAPSEVTQGTSRAAERLLSGPQESPSERVQGSGSVMELIGR